MTSSPPFTLSPFAPEYNRVPPGVTPDPNAPPPSFLPPPLPPQPYFQPSPPPLLQPPFFPYPVPPPTHSTVYHFNNIYYHTSQNSTTPTPRPLPLRPPPPPSPPLSLPPNRQQQQRRDYSGQGRGRGREGRNFRSERVERNNERDTYNVKRRVETSSDCHKYRSKWDMQKEANLRHKVMPLKRDEEKTTVMIKNIPYACPRKELMSVLDIFCARENSMSRIEGTSQAAEELLFTSVAYDFLYLPIDFRTRKSRGFAFVNFTNAGAVWKFFDAFHLEDWGSAEEANKWPKKIEIVCAKIQGKEALVNHFSGSIFECETDEYLPVVFNPPRDGSGQHCKMTVIGNRRASFSHREHRSNHGP